jgi:hypothetical protein
MLYEIHPKEVSMARRAASSCFAFVVTLLVAVIIHRLWFAHRVLDWEGTLVDAIIAAGVAFAFESRRKEYEIEVNDEEISMRKGSSLAKRKVRHGYIHFWRESPGNIFREPTLRLSEHGAIYRFFFGYVSIPASVPKYEEIKNKAMSWIQIG